MRIKSIVILSFSGLIRSKTDFTAHQGTIYGSKTNDYEL